MTLILTELPFFPTNLLSFTKSLRYSHRIAIMQAQYSTPIKPNISLAIAIPQKPNISLVKCIITKAQY